MMDSTLSTSYDVNVYQLILYIGAIDRHDR